MPNAKPIPSPSPPTCGRTQGCRSPPIHPDNRKRKLDALSQGVDHLLHGGRASAKQHEIAQGQNCGIDHRRSPRPAIGDALRRRSAPSVVSLEVIKSSSWPLTRVVIRAYC